MDLTGKVIAILPANSGVSQRTGNPWMSQEYVIEVPGQYPRKCMFRIFGEDRIKQFNIQMGEDITVQFDIDAHEYNGRWFNSIRAYDVRPVDEQTQVSAQPIAGEAMPISEAPIVNSAEPVSDSAEDLPF